MAGGFRGLWDLVGPSAGTGTAVPPGPQMSPLRRPSGTIPSLVAGPERREHISRRSGEANVQDLAFGWGEPRDGERVGKQNAVWAFLNIAAGAANYDLAHKLPQKPIGIELFDVVPAKGVAPPDIGVQALRQDEWTQTLVKVKIVVRSGVTTGCTARFIVKGA